MNNAWFAFYPGDYGRKTAHLPVAENGAYLLLLIHYYATGKPLPNDKVSLYRIARAHGDDERAAVDSVVSQFFTLQDDGYHNSRADVELGKRAEFHNKLAAAGRKRWQQPGIELGSKPGLSQAASVAESQAIARPQPQPHPHPQPQEEKVKPAPKTCAIFPPLPEWMPLDAWEAYLELRKAKRAKVTPKAVALLVRDLSEWRDEGQDVRRILENSVRNGYTGIFANKEHGHAAANVPQSFDEARNQKTDAALRRVAASYGIG